MNNLDLNLKGIRRDETNKYSKACPKARRKDKSYYILNEAMQLIRLETN